MKKIIALILSVCMLMTIIPTTVFGATVVAGGSWLSDTYWSLDSDGFLLISGTPAKNQNPTRFPWQNYGNDVKKIVIEEGWTTLYSRMFERFYEVESVSLPDSLTKISTYAFQYCSKLTEIIIPRKVTSIADNAFSGCSKFKRIYGYTGTAAETFAINNNYTFVPQTEVFIETDKAAITMEVGKKDTISVSFLPVEQLDKSLIWETSDESVATVDGGIVTATGAGKAVITATSNADKAKSISCNILVFDKEVTDYGVAGNANWIFEADGTLTIYGKGKLKDFTSGSETGWYKYSSDIRKVKFSEGITHIGKYMFSVYYINLRTIELPGSLESIGSNAFEKTPISSVAFPKNLKHIGSYAFSETDIVEITLPDGFEILDAGAFNETPLVSAVLPDSMTSIGAYAFCETRLTNAIIPNGITSIPDSCFASCASLVYVVLPETVTSIGNNAFNSCYKLSLKLPSSVSAIGTASATRSAFTGCKAVYVEKGTYAENYMTKNYSTITKIIDENTVRVASVSIDKTATDVNHNASITLTATVSPQTATYGEIIWISENPNIATVANGVVKGIKRGKTKIFVISPDGNIMTACDVNIRARGNCGENLEWECFDDGKLVISGSGEMDAYKTYPKAPWNIYDITEVVIEEGVKSIGDYAFYENSNIKTVTLSDSVKKTGIYSFGYCKSLETVKFGGSPHLEEIGESCFSGCDSLKTIFIPDSVTMIKTGAFGVSRNKTVTLESENSNFVVDDNFLFTKDRKQMIANFGFNGEEYTVPEGVEIVDAYVFYGCGNLKRITYPKSVQRIASGSLYGCEAVEEIIVPFVGRTRDENRTRYSVFGAIFGTIGVSDELGVENFFVQRYAPNGNESLLTGTFLPKTLRKVTITDDETIPFGAFSGMNAITSITLPDNVQAIDGYAFYGADKITELNLPATLEFVETLAFDQCALLKDVYYGGTQSAWERVNVSSKNTMLSLATIHYSEKELVSKTPQIIVTDIADGKKAEISYSQDNAKIYYTLDGTDPTTESLSYSKEILFKTPVDKTIKAIEIIPGHDIGGVASKNVCVTKIDSAEIITDSTGAISFENIPQGASVYYTTDLQEPDVSSNLYSQPFTVESGTTVCAITLKHGFAASDKIIYKYVENIIEPQISLKSAQRVSKSTAVFDAEILNESELGNIERSFIYYEKSDPDSVMTVKADKDFVVTVENLKAQTEYCFAAVVMNGKKEGRSSVLEFTTTDFDVVQSLSLPRKAIRMQKWRTRKMQIQSLPQGAEGEELVWSSSDKKIINVSKNGEITANGEGTAVVTVSTADGYVKAQCNVTVYNKYLTGNYDFSELNMATNVCLPDEHGFDTKAEFGGNYLYALAYLTRWDGAVLEETDPYPKHNRLDLNEALYWDYPEVAHIQNAYIINGGSLNEKDRTGKTFKDAIMRYGGLYIMYVCCDTDAYGSVAQYCPPGENLEGVLHAVTIVGWDDNYPAENFDYTPPGDGAFICKDSWGTGAHSSGYFYLSYYDAFLKDATAVAYPVVESKDNYDTIWQYDPYGMMQYTSTGSTTYGANVFPEKGKSLTREEILRAVSFYTIRKNMQYEIYVVEDYKENSDLSKLGQPVASGSLRECGYHTIEFDEIYLQPGTRFGVVVKLISPDEHPARMAYEYATVNAVNARAGADESYISADGISWTDYTTKINNANLCIKAFTDNESANIEAPISAIDNFNREYKCDKVYEIEEMIELGAEFSPEFLEYYEEKKDENVSLFSMSDSEYGYGAMPPYFDMETHYGEDNTGEVFPEKYDMRELGFVSPVKNQLGYGTCWTFATYGAIESSMLMRESEEKLAGDCIGEITVVQTKGGTLTLDRELAFQNVPINANPVADKGYKFVYLVVNGEKIEGTTFTLTSDATVSAVFIKDLYEGITYFTDTSFELTDLGYKFTVNTLYELDNMFGMVALYDDKNRLVSLGEIAGETSPYVVTITENENAKYAKIFVWNSVGGMKPFEVNETLTLKK